MGNSLGIIRVFDLNLENEIKSLEDKSLSIKNNQVKTLHISDDGEFLISGYLGG